MRELFVSSGRPRLLVYSQDGLGLGHQRRTSSLISEFLQACPEASVLTVSDSPLGRFFPIAGNADYLKLPSIRKDGPGMWRPLQLSMAFDEVLELRRSLLLTTARSFQPDLVLVDHMPHGAMGELLPALEALEGTSARIVLGLRDILDAPQVIRRRWSLEGAYEAVIRHFAEVLVYGSRDVFDVTSNYTWPAEAAARVHYCGYVCPPPAKASAHYRRADRKAVSSGKTILAVAGGGADAYPLMRALVDGFPALASEVSCRATIVAGPFMPAKEYAELRRRARHERVAVRRVVPDLMNEMARADLIVAMAGYNTTTEILKLGRPALLVPRSGPSAEQRLRAERFSDRGWVRWVAPEMLPLGGLVPAIVQALDGEPTASLTRPDLSGRSTAVQRLLALIDATATSGSLASSAAAVASGPVA